VKIAAVIITCQGREALCQSTADALRATGWPEAWPILVSRDEAAEGTRQHRQQMNARNALCAAIALEPDFVMFLEDDVVFNAHVGYNLTQWRPIRERWLGMASLYNPTIHRAERCDAEHWFRADAGAVYGSQAYLFSLDTARYTAEHWHEVEGMQDIKMSRLAARGGWRIFYHSPSLVQHVGMNSTWGGGYHYAPDFDPQFRAPSAIPYLPSNGDHHIGEEIARLAAAHLIETGATGTRSYAEIPGWFDEEWLYDRMIAQAPNNATFVEVGCWLGKSTAYCASRIQECGKAISFYAVDTWLGSPSEPDMVEAAARAGGSVYDLFLANMEAAGVVDAIRPLRLPSVAAATLFANRSLDFVFIDADQSCAAVQGDIAAWRPKIKCGGVLAGHDWKTYASVQQAVTAMLPRDFAVEGNCWIHQARC
jgi:predicted O-methyltransferase YrrM